MKEEILKFFKGEVEDSDETLTKYSRDASIFEMRPQLVLFPKDSTDIQNLVKWVDENRIKYTDLSITMRAAGTCMSGGAINDSLIVDVTRYMNKILEVKKIPQENILPKFPGAKEVVVEGEAVVEPGCFYRDFEVETLKLDLILPCYTASKSLNALGGMVGNNSGGEKTLLYGKTEDYVKQLKVILSDGKECVIKPVTKNELDVKMMQEDQEGKMYRMVWNIIQRNREEIRDAKPQVSKNSAGYNIWNVADPEQAKRVEEYFDLTQLIIGSQGTLGLVTEITFRLVKVKKVSKLFAVFMHDLISLGTIVDKILKHNPESVESYDDKTLKLAVRFFPDFLKKKGVKDMLKFMFSFLPEFWMMVTGGFPKLVILVEFTGDTDMEVNEKMLKLDDALKSFNIKTHITLSTEEAEKYWDVRRESFSLLRKHVKDKHTAPFIDDIIVKPEHLPEFLPELNTILSQYNIVYTVAGHAGNGNFHIIPLMDFNDPKTVGIILDLSDKVYDLVIKYHGSITAEHNDGIIRTPYLKKMYGEKIYSIFEEIKKVFDPYNIFNPGKKVGAIQGDIEKYIIKSDPTAKHGS